MIASIVVHGLRYFTELWATRKRRAASFIPFLPHNYILYAILVAAFLCNWDSYNCAQQDVIHHWDPSEETFLSVEVLLHTLIYIFAGSSR
jgi:hypothetical protein